MQTEQLKKSPECTEKYILLQQPDAPEDEIDLLSLFKVIKKWLKVTIPLVILCIGGAVAYALQIAETFKSEAVLMNSSAAKAGGMASLLGGMNLPLDLPGGGGGKGEELTNFLNSRTIKERLIEKHALLPILFDKIWDQQNQKWLVADVKKTPTLLKGVEALKSFYTVKTDKKTNLITLSWEAGDPSFCSLMLRRVIAELKAYLDTEYMSEAKRTRIFVENQLEKALLELKIWMQKIPDEKLTMSEILLEREAATQVYQELRKQLELVKINEEKEMIQFKVLDEPFVPEKRFKPDRRMIVLLAGVTSSFAALFLSFFFEFISKARKKE